jgi:type 1 glutamine amidotransferase
MKLLALALVLAAAPGAADIKILIVDGQNNHNWKAMTPFMKAQLEKTGLFGVDVSTTPPAPPGKPKDETPEQKAEREKKAEALKGEWARWRPKFSDYKAVVLNYNGELWPEEVRKSFEDYVREGGGVHVVHAANNAFPQWAEYNKMIGLGWRDAKYGDRVFYNDQGELVREKAGQGKGAGHGKQHEFLVTIRDADHPLTRGLPKTWMHAQDELYHGQRGPAADMRILASAFDDPKQGGTGVHEPMLWVIPYGKGRVVTNVMGHENGKSLQCVGFVTLLNRTCEWLATDKVTLAVPEQFPTAEKSSAVAK